MNIAFSALLAAIISFTIGVIIGGEAISGSLLKDCQSAGVFRWGETVYECRARPNTQTEQERP